MAWWKWSKRSLVLAVEFRVEIKAPKSDNRRPERRIEAGDCDGKDQGFQQAS